MHVIDTIVSIIVIVVAVSIPMIFVITAVAFVNNERTDIELVGKGSSDIQPTNYSGNNMQTDIRESNLPKEYGVESVVKNASENVIKERIFLAPNESIAYKIDVRIPDGKEMRITGSIEVYGTNGVIFELLDSKGEYPCDLQQQCGFYIYGKERYTTSVVKNDEVDASEHRINIKPDEEYYQLKITNDSTALQVVDIDLKIG